MKYFHSVILVLLLKYKTLNTPVLTQKISTLFFLSGWKIHTCSSNRRWDFHISLSGLSSGITPTTPSASGQQPSSSNQSANRACARIPGACSMGSTFLLGPTLLSPPYISPQVSCTWCIWPHYSLINSWTYIWSAANTSYWWFPARLSARLLTPGSCRAVLQAFWCPQFSVIHRSCGGFKWGVPRSAAKARNCCLWFLW